MLFAIGWVVVRSSREPYIALMQSGSATADLDAEMRVDDEVARADDTLFDALQAYLGRHEAPDLEWHFRRKMNNVQGILQFASSRNHRGLEPTVLELLRWIGENGPGSYGIVYLHDDEDVGPERDKSNEYRIWRLLRGKLEELEDPFFSPIVPTIDPPER